MSARHIYSNWHIVLLGAATLVVTGFAANAVRYETTGLSKSTYLVRDRWTGALSFCSFANCRVINPQPEHRPSTVMPRVQPTPRGQVAATASDDWSRLSDDEFMEAVLGKPLDCYALTPSPGLDCTSKGEAKSSGSADGEVAKRQANEKSN
jgi:hypothetical protein